MPLSRIVSRHVMHPRRIAVNSLLVGVLFFILFISIVFSITWYKRSASHDRLTHYTRDYISQVFTELHHSLQPLLTPPFPDCHASNADLTARAAFGSNIRAILLVKDAIAYCSSATGAFSLAVQTFSPTTHLDRPIDMNLLAGTPRVPGKPALVLWLQNPHQPRSGILTTIDINLTPYLLLASRQQEITGMAMVAKDRALTTWSKNILPASLLPTTPLRQFSLPHYPITFYLYGSTLAPRDVEFIVLAGILLALLVSAISYTLLILNMRPGKEILLGIKRGEFHVEYQPLINSDTGHMYGLEALLRWTHPVAGRVPAEAFIQYAEVQNLIVPLTRHLFELVARDAAELKKALPCGLQLGLNLSPSHLSSPQFRQDITHWVAAMPPNHFAYVFEITERAMVANDHASEIFSWMHDNQFKIAIDDFGTGHSALIYLEKYRFDYLKIDRGFVQSIGRQTVTSPVLDAVIMLAKRLNLNTVAEGVETAEQAAWLMARGVTHLQGYLFSRPLTVTQLIAWHQQQKDLRVLKAVEEN